MICADLQAVRPPHRILTIGSQYGLAGQPTLEPVIGAVLAVSSCAPIGVNGEVLGEFSCHQGTLEHGWGVAQVVVHGTTQAVRQLPVAGSPADPCGWLGGELLSTPNFVISQIPSVGTTAALPFAQFDHEHFNEGCSSASEHAHVYQQARLGTLWTKRQLTSFSLRLAGLITARSE
jgi:hypothetical protein